MDRAIDFQFATLDSVAQPGQSRIQMCHHGLEECFGVLRQLEVAVAVITSGLPSLVGNQ
ncbi:hypothetical protein D9M73_296750 [compost metagenome]